MQKRKEKKKWKNEKLRSWEIINEMRCTEKLIHDWMLNFTTHRHSLAYPLWLCLSSPFATEMYGWWIHTLLLILPRWNLCKLFWSVSSDKINPENDASASLPQLKSKMQAHSADARSHNTRSKMDLPEPLTCNFTMLLLLLFKFIGVYHSFMNVM